MTQATAIIPARGGSVSVPRKNLRLVGGVPLVVRTIRAALAAETVDRVVVSTDDPEIAALARRAGAEVIDRPPELAGPDVTIADVVAHAVDRDGPVVVCQPTSPFTDGALVDLVVGCLLDDPAAYDSVETVTAHRHALYDVHGAPIHGQLVNRQEADVVAWVPTGAVRAMRTFPATGGPSSGSPMVGDCHGLIDPAEERNLSPGLAARYALDVDTPEDFAVARDLASRGRISFVVAAGDDVGSGHLHRCLTLADELSHHRIEFNLIDGEGNLALGWPDRLTEDRGYSTARSDLPGDVVVYDCLEALDLAEVRQHQAEGMRVVVLECLDPQIVAAADLAVNSLYDGPPGALCGPYWEPLRPEFSVGAAPLHRGGQGDRQPRVLVAFGGTDPSELTERFAEVALGSQYDEARLPEVKVLWPPGRPGGSKPAEGSIADLLDIDWSMPPHRWEGAVSDAFAWADLVITSGGRTVLEAAAMGTPVVAVCAHEREEHHAPLPGVMWLGHHATVSDLAVSGAVGWLLDRPDERAARSARARAAVDPAGATARLADMIDRLVRG